jgi:hypothetical protein
MAAAFLLPLASEVFELLRRPLLGVLADFRLCFFDARFGELRAP